MKRPLATPLAALTAAAAVTVLAGCAAPGSMQSSPGNGLVTMKSPYDARQTRARLEAELQRRGLAIAAQIDHAAAAQQVGLALRPTAVVIFGNPQAGTPLMNCAQGVGIDLPMKALVWTDGAGTTWLAYNDPAWLVQRHGAAECPAAANVAKALADVAAATVAR